MFPSKAPHATILAPLPVTQGAPACSALLKEGTKPLQTPIVGPLHAPSTAGTPTAWLSPAVPRLAVEPSLPMASSSVCTWRAQSTWPPPQQYPGSLIARVQEPGGHGFVSSPVHGHHRRHVGQPVSGPWGHVRLPHPAPRCTDCPHLARNHTQQPQPTADSQPLSATCVHRASQAPAAQGQPGWSHSAPVSDENAGPRGVSPAPASPALQAERWACVPRARTRIPARGSPPS